MYHLTISLLGCFLFSYPFLKICLYSADRDFFLLSKMLQIFFIILSFFLLCGVIFYHNRDKFQLGRMHPSHLLEILDFHLSEDFPTQSSIYMSIFFFVLCFIFKFLIHLELIFVSHQCEVPV